MGGLGASGTGEGAVLADSCGRIVKSLRLSVTDRCNMRCEYCLPKGSGPFDGNDALLSFDEITCVVRVASRLGVNRVRITGGEPLLRPGVPELIAQLKRETTVQEVALTTNGMLLERHVDALAAAGLDRLTVSVDSLDPERFKKITCTGSLDDVWRGIERAAVAGLRPLKINVLVLKGMNDDEIDAWVELTRHHDLVVRFLELMPVGEGANPELADRYVDLTRVRQRLQGQYGLVPRSGLPGNGPARYWQIPDAQGVLGFITPISDRYCDTCSRFRLSSTGDLRPCLAYETSVPLRDAARARDEALLEARFSSAAALKPMGHQWTEGGITLIRMSKIGG
ncbi:MAG: GTP 3',8-cyclase MoaA [Deltaproteobacteria bacterium]|nr:GTP 3',8-cyclase MoaA [Deltaproteobacteria bacterium]